MQEKSAVLEVSLESSLDGIAMTDLQGRLLLANLLSVAGVWAGWREEDVSEIMLRSFNFGVIDKSLSWIVKRILRRELDDMWKLIENNLETADATYREANS